jgi:hypothetical protein
MVMDLQGFQRLAGSMLLQAMEDLLSDSAKLRREALEWIDDKNGDELSFAECCEMLGRDPQQMRGLMRRRLCRDLADMPLDVLMPILGLPDTGALTN